MPDGSYNLIAKAFDETELVSEILLSVRWEWCTEEADVYKWVQR